MLKPTLRYLLPLALCAHCALADDRAPFSRTVFIGDSLTDSGWFRPLFTTLAGARAAQWGRFTTGPDLVWSEHLANFYGTDATSRTGFGSGGQMGDNYAIFSARVSGPLLVQPLSTQYQRYLNDNGGQVDSRALYTVWGGANDLFVSSVLVPLAPSIRSSAVSAQADIIQDLQNRGARYVLVPNIPDIGLTPLFKFFGSTFSGWGTSLSRDYNQALYAELSRRGLSVIPLDTFGLLQEATADPARYGFSNITGTACTPQLIIQSGFCNPSTYASPNAGQDYLFADGVHPAGMAQRAMADLAIAMLEGPRQIAALSQSSASSGRNRASRVARQVTRQAGSENGLQPWLDMRGDFQRGGAGSAYRSNSPALLAGLGWRQGNFSLGGFAGYARGNYDFSERRGHWKQREATLGSYFGLRYGSGGWLLGQLSYSWLNLEVTRQVPLATTTRRHQGETDARNLTAALDVGWDFHQGDLSHGPVAGIALQRIKVDGFAENHPEQSSSLAYSQQTLDSQVGHLGWQASFQWDKHFTPYLRLSFEREFKQPPREVWARSQSMPETMPYAVPGLDTERNWLSATLGLRTQLAGLPADFGLELRRAKNSGNQGMLFVRVGNNGY